jgi:hypothetical protein
MTISSVFTTLKQATDGIFDKTSAEQAVSSDPFISALNVKTIPEAEIPVSLEQELYAPKSYPTIHAGDSWVYEFSSRALDTGVMKYKKLSLGVKVTEDEFNQKSGTVLRSMIEKELKQNNDYLRMNVQKWLAATNVLDPKFQYMFGVSTAGTLSNPNDMCTTTGTIEPCNGIIWSGATQTVNNVATFALTIEKAFKKRIDTNSLRYPQFKRYTWFVHPIFKAILDSNSDILDATNKVRSTNSFTTDLANKKIDVVECVYIDSTYTGAAALASVSCVVADPKENFTIWLGVPTDGAGWDEWTWIDNGEVKFAAKRKKVLFACEQTPFLVCSSNL